MSEWTSPWEYVTRTQTLDTLVDDSNQQYFRPSHPFPPPPPSSSSPSYKRSPFESSLVLDEQQQSKLLVDWNKEFQLALHEVKETCKWKFTIFDDDDADKVSCTYKLLNVIRDFEFYAQSYAKLIISEQFLPEAKRTVVPVTSKLKGIAGGEKYIAYGILFKFATKNSSKELYGSDEFAGKAMSLDLLGCSKVCEVWDSKICVPLMTMISHRGFRVLAMAILPITGKDTLVYGTCDAGNQVVNNNEAFNKESLKLAKYLNLKTHIVKGCQIHTAVDCEGHVGLDGRLYMLDFARLFPPEAPSASSPRNSHLFQTLRPEFVKSYSSPLNSDSFSNFNLLGNENAISNVQKNVEQVKESTHFLYENTIPRFVNFILKLQEEDIELYRSGRMKLSSLMHSFGINNRHLGKILLELIKIKSNDPSNSKVGFMIEYMKTAIIIRALKSIMRVRMRDTAQKAYYCGMSDFEAEKINLLGCLNNLLYFNSNAHLLTGQKLKLHKERLKSHNVLYLELLSVIKQKFRLSNEVLKQYFSDKNINRPMIFSRVCSLLNLDIADFARNERLSLKGFGNFLDETDLKMVNPKCTSLQIANFIEALYFSSKSVRFVGPRALAFLNEAFNFILKSSIHFSDNPIIRAEVMKIMFRLAINSMESKTSLWYLSECIKYNSRISSSDSKKDEGLLRFAMNFSEYTKSVSVQNASAEILAVCATPEENSCIAVTSSAEAFLFDLQLNYYDSCKASDHLCTIISSILPKAANEYAVVVQDETSLLLSISESTDRLNGMAQSDDDIKSASSIQIEPRSLESNAFLKIIQVKSKKLKVKKFDLSFASRVSDSTWQNSLHRIQSCKFKIQETLFIAISVTSNDLHIYRESDMQLHQSIRIEGEFDIKSITLFKDTLKEVKSTYLACACSDHVIRIVDLCNTSQVTCLGLELNLNASKGHTDSVNAITYFKRKEKPYLATAGADGTIRIWNLNKLSTIFIFRGHSNTITSLRYIPGYRLLLSTSLDSSMRLWSVEFWSCVKIMSCFDDDELNCCEFTVSVNHLSLYTAGAKGLIYMIQFDLSSAGRSSSMQVVQPDKMCKVS